MDTVAQFADVLDFDFELISVFEEHRRRPPCSDSGWCSCKNQIARLQSDKLRQVRDQEIDLEDHVTGVGTLHRFCLLYTSDAADE